MSTERCKSLLQETLIPSGQQRYMLPSEPLLPPSIFLSLPFLPFLLFFFLSFILLYAYASNSPHLTISIPQTTIYFPDCEIEVQSVSERSEKSHF